MKEVEEVRLCLYLGARMTRMTGDELNDCVTNDLRSLDDPSVL